MNGVLLLNIGGPETLADVRPFLYRLFSDPEIIRIKNTALRGLLACAISRAREKKSKNLYRLIGGGSPLRRITESQAAALGATLTAKGISARVYIGMLCSKPSIEEAFKSIAADGIRRLILLPLFPQYSETTTGACFRRVRTLAGRLELLETIDMLFIKDWYENPLYIDAAADTAAAGLDRFIGKEHSDVHILYSAHSLPERYIKEGDPYLDQTRKCVSLINKRLNERLNYETEFSMAFQSKVGPVKWLGPSVESVLRTLAGRGVRKILTVPVSFVSDNLETLYDMDIAYRIMASELGIMEFQCAEPMNGHPEFIAALASIVLSAAESNN